MTKETVRFPDGLVDRIRAAVEDSELFESRSEFHRVSSELLLDLLDPEHEPTNFSYRELRTEIEAELGVDLAGTPAPADGDDREPGTFLSAYVEVRRRALRGDLTGAREAIDRRYDPADPEALLLDEVIGQHREAGQVLTDEREPTTGAGDAAGGSEAPPGAGGRPTSADGGEPAPDAGDDREGSHPSGGTGPGRE
jgi:Arc/MetJ-type ribon-helix-helix transcriptional regulator